MCTVRWPVIRSIFAFDVHTSTDLQCISCICVCMYVVYVHVKQYTKFNIHSTMYTKNMYAEFELLYVCLYYVRACKRSMREKWILFQLYASLRGGGGIKKAIFSNNNNKNYNNTVCSPPKSYQVYLFSLRIFMFECVWFDFFSYIFCASILCK